MAQFTVTEGYKCFCSTSYFLLHIYFQSNFGGTEISEILVRLLIYKFRDSHSISFTITTANIPRPLQADSSSKYAKSFDSFTVKSVDIFILKTVLHNKCTRFAGYVLRVGLRTYSFTIFLLKLLK
jgi:hypothetical protein